MAVNDTTLADPDFGSFSDWVELYNAGVDRVDLAGFFLSDDPAEPTKWPIPAGTSIGPGSYLIFWCDDADTGRHTNFRLSASGESVGLYGADGRIIDAQPFGPQTADISQGRSPDGLGGIFFFDQPTPGRSNAVTGYLGVMSEPQTNLPAGFLPAPTSIELFGGSVGEIHFTTDGSVPTAASPRYQTPIFLDQTTVVRAAAFEDGYIPSNVVTRTYLVGEDRRLPVVSLSTDPDNFFDDENGIYVRGTNGIPGYCRTIPLNWNQDWERPVHVELFEPDGTLGFSIDAGVKIHGGCTRIYPQKSLAIFARRQYGAPRIDYPIFGDAGLESYNNLVLRSSAQDWWRTMFRDGMIQSVIAQGMDLETQLYRPAIVFLNGEYWGIHNLREKQNEHYFADYFRHSPEQIEILEGDKIDVIGQSTHYDEMMAYMLSSDMSRPETLDAVRTWMDVDNYIDYLIAEIFVANADWPGNNLKFWRPMTPDGRWRWVIFDLDFGYGGNANGQYWSNTLSLATDPNGSEWPNPPWSTLLFRTLLENPTFQDEFIQRFAVHINTTFHPDLVLATIDSLRTAIAHEIPRHKARWPESMSLGTSWDALVEVMTEFAQKRPLHVRPHFNDEFELSGSSRLTIRVVGHEGGQVLAHDVPLPVPHFSGGFFRGVPVRLTALPRPGYHFEGWSGDVRSVTDTTSVVLNADADITATFVPNVVSATETESPPLADRLIGNYPNPFDAVSRIDFEVALPGPVQIRIYDVLGRQRSVLVNRSLSAGKHRVMFEGSSWAPGVYMAVMETARSTRTRALTVVR